MIEKLHLSVFMAGFFAFFIADILIGVLFSKPTFLKNTTNKKDIMRAFIVPLFIIVIALSYHYVYGGYDSNFSYKIFIEILSFNLIFLGARIFAYDKFIMQKIIIRNL